MTPIRAGSLSGRVLGGRSQRPPSWVGGDPPCPRLQAGLLEPSSFRGCSPRPPRPELCTLSGCPSGPAWADPQCLLAPGLLRSWRAPGCCALMLPTGSLGPLFLERRLQGVGSLSRPPTPKPPGPAPAHCQGAPEEGEARMLTEGTGYGRMPGARLRDSRVLGLEWGLRVSCCIFWVKGCSLPGLYTETGVRDGGGEVTAQPTPFPLPGCLGRRHWEATRPSSWFWPLGLPSPLSVSVQSLLCTIGLFT